MSDQGDREREDNLGVGIVLVLAIAFLGWYLIYLGIEATVWLVTGG